MPGRWCAGAKVFAQVTATGTHTKFGRSAELIRTARVVSSQQKAVLLVVRNLSAFNGFVILILVGYAGYLKMPLTEIIPLILSAVLASIPVALPGNIHLGVRVGGPRACKAWSSPNSPFRRG